MPRPLALPLWFSISISLWACRRTPREWSERHLVANTQAKIGQWKNTLEQYALIDAVVEKWPETSKMRVIYTPTRVLALLHTTDHDRALDTAEKYHKYVRSLLGDQHRDTALAEGYLAVAKTHKGATEAALEHFKSAARSWPQARAEQTMTKRPALRTSRRTGATSSRTISPSWRAPGTPTSKRRSRASILPTGCVGTPSTRRFRHRRRVRRSPTRGWRSLHAANRISRS